MEWKDISTAPKDGSLILLCHYANYGPFSGKFVDGDWYALCDLEDATGITSRPTHWMPLPDAPETQP